MTAAMEFEIIPSLNFLLPWILGIGKVATMIGLLGTVISMIGTFDLLGKAAESGAAAERGVQGKASSEIGLALWATALGLITAIPLVFAHVQFKAWIHRFELKMRNAAQKLIGLVQTARSPAAATGTLSRPASAATSGRGDARRGLEDELKHG
jgi:biopolymer transport protein ExbB